MFTQKFNSQKIIIASFFIFTFLSFMLFMSAPVAGHFDVDSPVYQTIAQNFYTNNSLLDPNNPMSAPVFPLGYPLFMGLIYKLCGPHYAAIIWVQVVLSLLTMLLVFRIARLLFNDVTAHIAVLLMSCNLAFLVYSQMILSEVLLAFCLTLFLERFLYYLKTDRLACLIQAAVLFGCSLLIKSIALLFFPVVVYVMYRRKKNLEDILVFLVFFSLPLFVYLIRTYYVYGVWAFTPQAYVNVYHYFLPKVIAQVKGISYVDARAMIPFTGAHSLDLSGWNQARQMLLSTLFKHPFTCITIWLHNLCKTVFGLFTTQLKALLNPALKGGVCSFARMQGSFFMRMYNYIACGTQSHVVIALGFVQALWLLLRYVLVLISLFFLYHKERYTECILFASFIFVCTFITGFDGCFRFRMAYEAVLTVLAALSISMLWTKKKLSSFWSMV